MIISHLIGGLGNQMFQYASGKALAMEKNTNLKLDISDFKNYKLHNGFELNSVFESNFEIASVQDVNKLLGLQSQSLYKKIIARPHFKFLRKSNFIVEPNLNYFEGIKYAKRNSYLQGYWQSEKYFKKYSNEIKSDFKFTSNLNSQNIELIKKFSTVNSVSIHIRRGDYLSNKRAYAFHGVCSLKYYTDAINYISNQISSPIFYIFSDDINWAIQNLKIKFPSFYISHNHGHDSFNDMRLISHCKHHIIANSSFSWWGAWLGNNQSKIVIAPKLWFNRSIQPNDLIPEDWVKL